ncbi:MAG: thiamine pyrophosphate-binding protein, partial [Telmatospirillum sp.]|nr:thiamine pyrophosphate-binding protein [Telmatospirillum sp.]
ARPRPPRPGVGTALRRISEKYDVAVATTVGSKGVFPETHDNYLGVYGYSGHHRAIRMLTEDPPDTLILLGFDTTQWTSLAWDPALRPARTLIQVGTRPGDIDFVIPADIAVVSDEEVFLRDLEASGVLSASRADNRAYLDRAAGWPLLHPVEPVDDGHLHPADVVLALNRLLPDHICIADSGNHRSFATHYWRTDIQNGFFSANTICGMGWAIPAAVGVSFARDEPCVVITGDGCMLMHGMEIQTAARYRRPVIYVVFNNSSYGATYFNNIHNIPEMSALPTHAWAMFARSLGAAGHRVTSLDELEEAVVAARAATGATVIDVLCSKLPETPAHRYKQNVKSSGVL